MRPGAIVDFVRQLGTKLLKFRFVAHFPRKLEDLVVVFFLSK